MSMLIIGQAEDQALIISDTLVVDANNRPEMFQQKVWPLPHLNMVIAVTGTANVGTDLYQWITARPGLTDIETVNRWAPRMLRKIYEVLRLEHGPLGRSTIYLLGFPEGTDRLVRYTYSSHRDNFASARSEGGSFHVKPLPTEDFDPGIPTTEEDYLKLVYQIRDGNRAGIEAGTGVPIGGELFLTFVENWRISTRRFHRFDDYDESLAAMQSRNP